MESHLHADSMFRRAASDNPSSCLVVRQPQRADDACERRLANSEFAVGATATAVKQAPSGSNVVRSAICFVLGSRPTRWPVDSQSSRVADIDGSVARRARASPIGLRKRRQERLRRRLQIPAAGWSFTGFDAVQERGVEAKLRTLSDDRADVPTVAAQAGQLISNNWDRYPTFGRRC